MSTSNGDARVVQIYQRLSKDAAPHCPLEVGPEDTAGAVVSNAVVTLGLDTTRRYSLLEVRTSRSEERRLRVDDSPLERVLLWPPEAQKWHPLSLGYYFVLEEAEQKPAEEYDDLCCLPAVTEDTVVEALRRRFLKRKIYTYAGNVLIALNPNKFLPAYYNPKYVKMYENQPLGKLSPHIFAVADMAYRTMLNRKVDQCMVISGESGSGKTESSSYLVHCLTALSQQTYCSGMERIILGSSPVLQAFGNAKTIANDNSSRFGKFMQLNYLESGVIRGAVIKKYLLEKCRLVHRDKRERNYHVFYYLLAGASKEEREEFSLLAPQDYLYLKQEDLCLDDEEKLVQGYKRLHQAMDMVGFLPSTKKHIFSTLSAILLLGNVTFTLPENNKAVEAGPAEILSTLSDLLKVRKELLVKTLTERRVSSDNDTVYSQYTLQEALAVRDSMAKCLYGALFDWIILHINHAMLNRRDMEESVSCLSIGVLDLFGLENLHTNHFEQLCINYSNEKLQYYINQQIFTFQQKDYEAEGISWQRFEYSDNSMCIQLISQGLFNLLDEESTLPQAKDKLLLGKLVLQFKDNSLFAASVDRESSFVIQHFAGSVTYSIKGFLEKNTEHVRPEVISLLRGSERAFLHQLVASSPEAVFRWGVLRATFHILAVFKNLGRKHAEKMVAQRPSRKSLKDIKHSSSHMDRTSSNSCTLDFSFDRSDEHPLDVFEDIFSDYEKRKKTKAGRRKQLIPKNLMTLRSLQHVLGFKTWKSERQPEAATVCMQFEAALAKLMDTVRKAEPFFIFCLRSNAEKKENHVDDKLLRHQIRYTGILHVVHALKSGYNAKYTFQEFVKKFQILLPKEATEYTEQITKLFTRLGLDQTAYQIGKTKVFLKEKERQLLQDTLNKEVMRHIVVLQRWFRACLIRMHFLQKRDASLIIQRNWREFQENRNRAASVIQTAWQASLKKPEEELKMSTEGMSTGSRPSRASSSRKGIRRQHKVELSPNRTEQGDADNGQSPASKERRGGRGSPPPLTRPLSLPLDPKVGSDDGDGAGESQKSSSLQRYKDTGNFKEKAERWREKISDESSPEVNRRQLKRRDDFQHKGKSMSADELSKISSSGSDSSPSASEVRVRLRKNPKRKRRLAYARSGLMINFGGSKESEYWSFPLPPLSPRASTLKSSASSADVRGLKSLVKRRTEPDGSRYSLPVTNSNEDSVQHRSNQSPLTTPEKIWRLGRFLRKRPPKIPTNIDVPSQEKSMTLASYKPDPYKMPEQNSGRPARNPTIKISRATRAPQWNCSLDREIQDPKELRNLDEFLGNQMNDLRLRIKELSPTENIFLMATMQFRETIKGMFSVQKPQIGYKDLMKGYQNKVSSLAGPKNKNEVSLVVNLFQSMVDGFIRGELKRMDSEPDKATKTTKKRRKKHKCPDSPLDHRFSTYQVTIMQSCDLCGSYIWAMEKAYVCSACKLICHKKCLSKIITDCSTRCARQDDCVPGALHFGVQVCVLTSKTNPVPKVVELLLMYVEMNGLYTEGIYRKSGSACRARELHQIMEMDPEAANLDNYPIHTITGLVKRWLRELPDPLMTFSLYSDFLHAVEFPERAERIRAVYQKVDELPLSNYKTLERLILHLVRVAKEQDSNKMTPSSLAIVFAPCILRSPDFDDPFLGMKDVAKTTTCVEILISEQFRRYKETLQNIQQLEYAEDVAINQLKLKRQNTIVEKQSELENPDQTDSEERTLIERIRSIKQEKLDLACTLPDLEQENSDNDILDSSSSMSTESLDDHLGSLDSEGQ
ncbi:unconventional myosin-IXb isoform X2 [Syngnathoides biaculeatus]|uniref:unconventional myosin-IXb isoform X2 n=1 Tax=Syngnathoides biaculeatus TaxID=300417 RepID=UPI002ADD7C6A|nr:unconventional myosin-IXb isoform X2 [Syngnathoides biaculeatus]XP_061694254.1 unconventional myosin-IXb isoform X2 [Syngnathoides biaculeatus]